MKNSLSDLNNHLFAQIERLGDEDLTGEKLAEEIERGKAITGVAAQIISNGTLVLKATEMSCNINGRSKLALPEFLGESQ